MIHRFHKIPAAYSPIFSLIQLNPYIVKYIFDLIVKLCSRQVVSYIGVQERNVILQSYHLYEYAA